MTDGLLLDTHIALWLDSGDTRLRARTRSTIDDCRQGGGTIFLSSVSAWEVAMLVDAERIELDLPVEAWINRFIARPGIQMVLLGWQAASRSYELRGLEHRDPADRLLIATAIDLGCLLVTYDRRIESFARRHGRRHGFAVAT